MSFRHPRPYFRDGDPYYCKCQKTARLLADELNLADGSWSPPSSRATAAASGCAPTPTSCSRPCRNAASAASPWSAPASRSIARDARGDRHREPRALPSAPAAPSSSTCLRSPRTPGTPPLRRPRGPPPAGADAGQRRLAGRPCRDALSTRPPAMPAGATPAGATNVRHRTVDAGFALSLREPRGRPHALRTLSPARALPRDQHHHARHPRVGGVLRGPRLQSLPHQRHLAAPYGVLTDGRVFLGLHQYKFPRRR